MDPNATGFSDSVNGFKLYDGTLLAYSNQFSDIENGSKFTIPSPDLNLSDVPYSALDPDPGIFTPSSTLSQDLDSVGSVSLSPDGSSFTPTSGWSPEGVASSSSDDSESSDPLLKYIGQMLMEEDIEDKPSMFYDPLALQATEKSLYDVLGEQQQNYPLLHNQPQLYVNDSIGSYSSFSGSIIDFSGNSGGVTSTNSGTSDFVDTLFNGDVVELNPPLLPGSLPGNYQLESDSQQPNSQYSVSLPESAANIGDGLMSSSVNELLAQNMFSDKESMLQFKRGFEEASKFLPTSNQLVIDVENYNFSKEQKKETSMVAVKVERDERENSPEQLRSRKNHARGNPDLEEERSNKQSAVSREENELSEMFDKVLLICTDANGKPLLCHAEDPVEAVQKGASNSLQQNGQTNGSNGGKSRGRKQGKKETVDLRTLLILCAQAVSTNDFRTANELLKQIRQHSSPTGDGSQRLAHFFANGLEARLAGSGMANKTFFTSFAQKTTTADILKCYKVHLSACPFKKLSNLFANKMFMHMAENSPTLHIVDFGILYGFQWPSLIQLLSMRPGGPPKLRITGIEFPQPGFRPAERIEETGHRLAKYCERFNVPFEYNGIASQNWETIRIEDFKMRTGEVLAVNCLSRFKYLLDETVEVDCPRNAVLSLIRKMNPDIFINAIVNGAYNTPFFVTRFREALFHFSSLFDMWDTTIPRDNQERLTFEREFYGRDIINTIASEGLERVERPETYKQWQVRITRAGFKQLPLDRELLSKLQMKLKAWNYHKDFVIDEDKHWMLQGWKGRIVYATACWVPA